MWLNRCRRTALIFAWVITTVSSVCAEDWAGWYAGLGVGPLVGGQRTVTDEHFHYSGFAVDAFLGWRSETPAIYGIEIGARTFIPTYRALNPHLGSNRLEPVEVAAHSQLSARAQVGKIIGPALFYLAGGVVISDQAFAPGTTRNTRHTTHLGVVGAVGADFDMDNGVFMRGELSVTALDRQNPYPETAGFFFDPFVQPAAKIALGVQF